jgi:two-component SAPR family response regulator
LLEEGYYRLCPTVWVLTDVEEFDRRYEQGCRLEKINRVEGAAEYEAAIELYRGDYLLEHLYEDWTMVERERLSNAYVDMLERLALYYKQTQQLQKRIQLCYRILDFSNSYRVRLNESAFGLRAHREAPPITRHSRASGNPL